MGSANTWTSGTGQGTRLRGHLDEAGHGDSVAAVFVEPRPDLGHDWDHGLVFRPSHLEAVEDDGSVGTARADCLEPGGAR